MTKFGILGPIELCDGERRVPVGGSRQLSLLAFLLVHANRAVSNDDLVDAVWAGQDAAGSVKRLQVAVARLRKALDVGVGATRGTQTLRSVAGGYLLSVGPGELDAEVFAAGVAEGREALDRGEPERASDVLAEAVALWRGPALADVAYKDFAQAEIRRLEELRLTAVEARVEADLLLGRHADLVAELEGLMAAHPSRERLAGQLMLAHYRCGRQADALEVYQRTRAHLAGELGLEPGPALTALQAAILEQAPSLEPSHGPRGASPRAARWPVLPNPTVGRDGDVRAVAEQLRSEGVRLLTLVGPGGVGKTRLAIEAARTLRADFANGASFVELAVVSEPREVASAIARALAAPMRMGEPPTAALRRFLGDRRFLLVLDNFEHLVEGAPLVAELVSACPQLTILLTSREPIRLAAERLYPVRPLALPGSDGLSPPELERFGAVAMFCERARARDPDFALDESNARAVNEICVRLDGLPLAMELAAARIGSLAPAELATRLDRALTVLVSGTRDAPERQRTLRATIDWSYELLSDVERLAFARMAVFVAGATVATAEHVTETTLDTLDSLVAKQMLVRRDDRLHMLETVREYALEKLGRNPDADATYDRLANWSLRFMQRSTPHLVRADRIEWLARLDAEYPNTLAALSWALDRGWAALAQQLVGALGDYWWRSGRWTDGLPWVDAALEPTGSAPPEVRARALLYRARLRGSRRRQRHREDLEASLALFRACDDAAGIALCLAHLAAAESWVGHHDRAAALAQEAIDVAADASDEDVLAFVLVQSAVAAEGYEQTAARASAAITYLERVGNLRQLGFVCNVTSYEAMAESRYRDALAWLDRGIDASRLLGDLNLVYLIRGNQGLANLFLDDLGEAGQRFRDALAVCRGGGSEEIIDETLLGLAAVSARNGELTLAAQLAGAARAHPSPGSSGLNEAAIWSRVEAMLGPARERLGPEHWDAAERRGGTLTVPDAIDLALARGRFAQTEPEALAPSGT